VKGSFGGRAPLVAVAAVSVIAVPLATSASAAAPTQPVSCAVLLVKTVNNKSTVTESKCTPTAATGGGGTSTTTSGSGALKGKSISTITWASGHGTTKSTVNYAPNTAGKGKCLAGATRLTITGAIVSSTGLVAKVIKVGQHVTASVCVYTAGAKKGQTTLEPGTLEKL
jgi:hypothetical protein